MVVGGQDTIIRRKRYVNRHPEFDHPHPSPSFDQALPHLVHFVYLLVLKVKGDVIVCFYVNLAEPREFAYFHAACYTIHLLVSVCM